MDERWIAHGVDLAVKTAYDVLKILEQERHGVQ